MAAAETTSLFRYPLRPQLSDSHQLSLCIKPASKVFADDVAREYRFPYNALGMLGADASVPNTAAGKRVRGSGTRTRTRTREDGMWGHVDDDVAGKLVAANVGDEADAGSHLRRGGTG